MGKQNRPEYVEKACEDIWEGGPTPCECIQGMVRGLQNLLKGSRCELNFRIIFFGETNEVL
ncbi:MAG: hypothetical protein U5K54_23150 [Cytophagales bacterium]|nr:hypothetical protein [Cytophagales bacterium]